MIPDETIGQSYVTTDSDGISGFNIKQFEGNNVYKIRYIRGLQSDVGFIEKDGLLGFNNDNPLPVVFRKAFDVLAMV